MIESKGRVVNITMDYESRKFRVLMELDSVSESAVNSISNKDLRITIMQWRERRSNDQNSYVWELYTKIAMALPSTPEEVHELMIDRYGIPFKDEDGYVVVTLKADRSPKSLNGYWRFFSESPDGKWKSWLKLKGTSELDSAEFAWFIDRVIEDAQELGIQTETANRKAEAERWLNQS